MILYRSSTRRRSHNRRHLQRHCPRQRRQRLAITRSPVRPGDTLNEIAVAFNVPRSQIICANNIRNINQIEVGQQLIIPLSGNSCATPIYIVQPGDTLSSIAARFGLSVYELAVYNGIADVNDIEAGDVLYIPAPGTIDRVNSEVCVQFRLPERLLHGQFYLYLIRMLYTMLSLPHVWSGDQFLFASY